MNNLARRISALESETDACGVVTICIRDSETRDEAIARHIAEGGTNPADAELVVIIDDGV